MFDLAAGKLQVLKTPSTPRNQSEGILAGIDQLGVEPNKLKPVVHGTTVAINTALERDGARLSILTTPARWPQSPTASVVTGLAQPPCTILVDGVTRGGERHPVNVSGYAGRHVAASDVAQNRLGRTLVRIAIAGATSTSNGIDVPRCEAQRLLGVYLLAIDRDGRGPSRLAAKKTECGMCDAV